LSQRELYIMDQLYDYRECSIVVVLCVLPDKFLLQSCHLSFLDGFRLNTWVQHSWSYCLFGGCWRKML